MEHLLRLVLAWIASFLLIFLPVFIEENVRFDLLLSIFSYLYKPVLYFLFDILQVIGLLLFFYTAVKTIIEVFSLKKK